MSKAAVKRAFTLGSVWEFWWMPESYKGTGADMVHAFRQVVKVQSNAVAFAKDPTPEGIAAATERPQRLATWLYFDSKEKESHEVTEAGDVRIVTEAGITLVYRKA